MSEETSPTTYDLYEDTEAHTESSLQYNKYVRRSKLAMAACAVLLVVTVMVSVSMGSISIPIPDVIRELLTLDSTSYFGSTIWDIRMPRIVAGILVGAGLALAGTVMQCILRNPLASPYTLGLSNAAALGAAFAILFIQGGRLGSTAFLDNPYVVAMTAFAFSMVATAVILLLTKYTGVSAEAMVLAGIAISAICSAGLTLMQYIADSVQLSAMVSWSFGDLGRSTWNWNFVIFFVFFPILMFFIMNRWNLNAIDAGDEISTGLGVNTERMRVVGLVLSSLLTSILVAGFGIVAFIGLLGPHISRMLVGSDHRVLIPMSALTGATILVLADVIARRVLSPMVLPVGILTSLLGGPLFIYLLLKRYKK